MTTVRTIGLTALVAAALAATAGTTEAAFNGGSFAANPNPPTQVVFTPGGSNAATATAVTIPNNLEIAATPNGDFVGLTGAALSLSSYNFTLAALPSPLTATFGTYTFTSTVSGALQGFNGLGDATMTVKFVGDLTGGAVSPGNSAPASLSFIVIQTNLGGGLGDPALAVSFVAGPEFGGSVPAPGGLALVAAAAPAFGLRRLLRRKA